MADWFAQISKPQPAAPQTADGKTDWASAVLKPQAPPRTAAAAIAERDANTRTVVQTDRLAKAQALRDMGLTDPRGQGNPDVPIEGFVRTEAPPIQPATSANFGASVKAGLVEDPDTKRRLIAQSLFPNDPNGAARIGFVDGRPVYVDDTGALREVSGTASRVGASIVANSPEMIAGAVGSATSSPILGGTAGAVGARGLKRAAAGVIFNEPQTISGNLKDLAGEAAVNVVGGAVAKGVTKFMDRGRTVDFTPDQVQTAEQARAYVKSTTGIDLDLAQASGDRKLIALRAFAARYPGKSAELIQAADEAQKGQLDAAVSRVLDTIGRSTPAEVAGQNGINAAAMVIDAAKAARDKAVAPYYDAARKVVLGSDVVESISADPLIARAARRVSRDPVYQRKLAGLPENSVGYWQQVKRNLDAGYEQATTSGNRTAASEYADAAKQLNEKLAAASPEYKQANEFFAKETREKITPLEDSPIGVLSRITNPKAATAASKLFSDPNITASQVRATRASILAQKDGEEAWNGLVRQWVGQQWDSAVKLTQGGESVNAAGKLRQALIGTPSQKAKMDAALGPGASQAFDDLMTAAESLSRTPISGSNTMRDLEIKDVLKGRAAVVFKWVTSLREQIRSGAEERAVREGVLSITEALQNPAKRNQLRVIVKMPPSQRKGIAIATVLSAQGLQTAAAGPADRMPDAPMQRAQRPGQQ